MTSLPWYPRARAAALYAAAWTPLVLMFVAAIGYSSPMPAWEVLLSALRSVAVAALLGLLVVAGARRWHWPARLSLGFVAAHIVAAAAYGFLWLAALLWMIRQSLANWDAVFVEVQAWWGWQAFDGFLVYWVVAGVTWARESGRVARERERALLEAEALRVKAELGALRGQLDPHFLFNTLHTAAVLTKHDPTTAASALERLADLLRYVLDAQRGARDEVPLADELSFVESYLALEALRLGDRLRVVREFSPETLALRLPSLALQPLVENALRYGISEVAEGGTLTLRGAVHDGALVLEVSDNGPGAAATHPPRGTGIGLDTLRQRLAARFGASAGIEVRSAPGQGFHVKLWLPASPLASGPRGI